MTVPPFATPASARIASGLAKLGLAQRHDAWRRAGGQGLTPTQEQILVQLAAAPRAELRLGAVADQLAVTPPTVSDAVAALERKGLVARRPDPADGRAVLAVLTDLGRDTAERVTRWPDVLLDAVGELDPVEQAVLLRALVKMIRGLQVRGRISPARMCVTCRFFRPYVHNDRQEPHHCAYVDAPFGNAGLQLDCRDQEPADPNVQADLWDRFVQEPHHNKEDVA